MTAQRILVFMRKGFLYLILTIVVLLSIVTVTRKLNTVAKGPAMPTKTLTVPELRQYAFSSALSGKECVARGICVAKNHTGVGYTVFLNGVGKDSTSLPLKCLLSEAAGTGFSSLELNTEMVVSGKLQFTAGMAELENVIVVSQNVAAIETY